jgi:hypothetical protein
LDRRDSASNESFVSLLLPASTIHSAGRSLLSHGIRPAKSLHRRIVVAAMLEQERAGFLEGRHISSLSGLNIVNIPATPKTVIPG